MPEETGMFMLRAPEADPKYGGLLRTAGLSESAHFDLHQASSYAFIFPQINRYDQLVRYDPFEIGLSVVIPDLAHSWDISGDELTYTFYLREGVTWHDGTPFTSADVKATFDRVVDPPQGVAMIRADLFEAVESITTPDDYTVEFKLRSPRGFFLNALALGWSTIEQKAALEEWNGDLKRARDRPGTGAFKFVSYAPGELWVHEKNEDYWNPDLPYVDEINLFVAESGTPTGAIFLAGQADFASSIGTIAYNEAQNKPGLNVTLHPHPMMGAVWINQEREVWQDPKVRKAMHLVTDYFAMSDATRDMAPLPVEGWLVTADVHWQEYFETAQNEPGWRRPTDEDIAEAQRLMAEAGYADGIKDVDFLVRTNEWMTTMAPLVQHWLKEHLKIESTIRTQPTAVSFEDMHRGEFDLTINATSLNLPIVQSYWAMVFRTDGSQNFGKFSNEAFDENLQMIVEESDPEKIKTLISNGIEILDEEVPMLTAVGISIPVGWTDRLKGADYSLRRSAYENLRFDHVWLDE